MSEQIFKKQYIIICDKEFKTKQSFFDLLTKQMLKSGIIIDEKSRSLVMKDYLNREAQGSTGFEKGVAIPHCRTKSAIKPALFIVKLKKPINWDSMDGQLTDKLFCIIVPEVENVDATANNLHMEILSKIAVGLMNNDLINEISNTWDTQELFNIVNDKILCNDKNEQVIEVDKKNSKKILVVSACTYGMAHTYMAEKKALDYGKEHGYDVKVETHGSKGVQNKITEEDLKSAEGVIIAVDKPLDLSHIKCDNIVKIRTIDLIKNPGKYFEQIINHTGKSKKEKAKELFTIQGYQRLFYGSSRGWNYVGWASFIVGILVYIVDKSPNFHPTTVHGLILAFAFAAILAPCLFVAYVSYNLTKNNSGVFFIVLFITLALSLYQKLHNFDLIHLNDQTWVQSWTHSPSLGIIGCAIIAIWICLGWYAVKLVRHHCPDKLFIKGCIFWILEVAIYFFLTLIYFLWVAHPLSIANDAIYTWWTNTDDRYWWFRWIIAFVFFELMIIDLGGPFNKWALVFSAILFFDSFAWNPTHPFLTPFTATALAIPIPCLCLGIRGWLLRNVLSTDEIQKSKVAAKAHFQGLSEPALFALEIYKWKGYLANVLIALIGAILISIFHLEFWGGFNSLWGIIFSFSSTGAGDSFAHLPFGNIAYAIVECGTIILGTIVYLVLLNPIHNKNNLNK